ncbi:hypothetical protein ABT008_20580 [Micromonospora sp. NPDC002389]|uniref:hypothetical protein n=1 Tax=Micromonospora sp. NPDC002389 TaxID=3154272 RepID=UPI00331AADEB
MTADRELDDALRGLARHGGQGRVHAAAEIRRRGDTRRRRRHVATVTVGVLLVAALGAGTAAIRLAGPPHTIPVGPAGPTPVPATDPPEVTPGPAVIDPPTGSSSPPTAPSRPGPDGTRPSVTDPSSPASGTSGSPSAGGGGVLSGQRQATVVRVDGIGGVSLRDEGGLGEVDGDEGHQLFVFVPQGGDTYLVRVAGAGDTCWESRSSGSSPLRVVGAACDPDAPRQRFSIVRDGERGGAPTYAISNHSAFLQHSPTRGLILEELGDASLTTYFRLVDNGAAPD